MSNVAKFVLLKVEFLLYQKIILYKNMYFFHVSR